MTLDFGPPQQVHVSIDVVEKTDEARRMPFHAAPTQELGDPGGMLALWTEYEQAMYDLALAGAPMRVDQTNCPVLHCIAPFDLPELAPYLPRLDDGARRYEDELYAVAANSAEAVPAALRLLKLEKPNNHEPAYEILTQISGETFGDRDYASWERWAASR